MNAATNAPLPPSRFFTPDEEEGGGTQQAGGEKGDRRTSNCVVGQYCDGDLDWVVLGLSGDVPLTNLSLHHLTNVGIAPVVVVEWGARSEGGGEE